VRSIRRNERRVGRCGYRCWSIESHRQSRGMRGPTRPRAQPEHATEHIGQRPFVPAAKLRNRRVIRRDVARHHTEGDALDAGALNAARGPHPARMGVEQQRHHHRRLVGQDGRARRPSRPHGTPTDQARRPRRAPSTPNAPPAPQSRTDGGIRNTRSLPPPMNFMPMPEGSRGDRTAPRFPTASGWSAHARGSSGPAAGTRRRGREGDGRSARGGQTSRCGYSRATSAR
jgi:hypothetical protein